MLARLNRQLRRFSTKLSNSCRSRRLTAAVRAFEEEFAEPYITEKQEYSILRNCHAGDVVFFGKRKGGSDFEQAVLAVTEGEFFHAGIIVNEKEIYHASMEGVQRITIEEAIQKIEPHYLEICSIDTSMDSRLSALNFCSSVEGWSYNDIFSPSKLDSQGRPALYCSQLITEAYPTINFPPHKMSFRNKEGRLIRHWIQYYRDRGHEIPHGQPGSHPSIIRISSVFQLLKTINLDQNRNFLMENTRFMEKLDLNYNIVSLNAFK